MKKKCKVLMLPTENTGVILRGVDVNDDLPLNLILPSEADEGWLRFGTNQHLYIVSEEDEIKEGNWFIWGNEESDYMIPQRCTDETINIVKHYHKVIATTDPELTEYCKGVHRLGEGCNLINSCDYPNCRTHKIPEDFITSFIEVNGIDEVMVEYDTYRNTSESWDSYKLKVRKDNTVIISQAKTTWNSEEVKEKLEDFFGYCSTLYGFTPQLGDVDDWIKKNI